MKNLQTRFTSGGAAVYLKIFFIRLGQGLQGDKFQINSIEANLTFPENIVEKADV